MGLCLGALAGFGFYLQQDHKTEFGAVLRFRLKNVQELQVVGVNFSSEEEVSEWMDPAIAELQVVTGGRATFQQVEIEERNITSLWKPVVLGSVIGGLLIVGCVYVWGDIIEYRRQIGSRDADASDS